MHSTWQSRVVCAHIQRGESLPVTWHLRIQAQTSVKCRQMYKVNANTSEVGPSCKQEQSVAPLDRAVLLASKKVAWKFYLQNWSAAGLPPPHSIWVRTSPWSVPFTCHPKQLSTLPMKTALPLVICTLQKRTGALCKLHCKIMRLAIDAAAVGMA